MKWSCSCVAWLFAIASEALHCAAPITTAHCASQRNCNPLPWSRDVGGAGDRDNGARGVVLCGTAAE